MLKVKRTYNLSDRTVRAVRELADEYHVATSQDAVVELAVSELQRRLTDEREAQRWAAAASDETFVTEARELEEAYGAIDLETWPG